MPPSLTLPGSSLLSYSPSKVAFPIEDDADGASLVAWTTTPWTLPSNVALCVHPSFTYVKVGASGLNGQSGEVPSA